MCIRDSLCCIIRSRKPHSGISAKREWLSDRLKEGHVFRKLNVKGTVFIEYAPLETARVPIEGSRDVYKRQGIPYYLKSFSRCMEKKKALHQMQRIKVSDIPQSYE